MALGAFSAVAVDVFYLGVVAVLLWVPLVWMMLLLFGMYIVLGSATVSVNLRMSKRKRQMSSALIGTFHRE